MTLEEIIAAFTAVAKAATALTGEVAAQRLRIIKLEDQVAAHDLQLKTAPEPGPKE